MNPNVIKGNLQIHGYTVATAAREAGVSQQYASCLVGGYCPELSNADKAIRFYQKVSAITGLPLEELEPRLFDHGSVIQAA